MGAYEITTGNGSLKGTNGENTRSFNLYRDQSYSLNLLNADKFSGVELPGVASKFKNGKENTRCRVLTPSMTRLLGPFLCLFIKDDN